MRSPLQDDPEVEDTFMVQLQEFGYTPVQPSHVRKKQKQIPQLPLAAPEDDGANAVLPLTAEQYTALDWLQCNLKPHQVEGVNWLLEVRAHRLRVLRRSYH